jgi:hypothetical protein
MKVTLRRSGIPPVIWQSDGTWSVDGWFLYAKEGVFPCFPMKFPEGILWSRSTSSTVVLCDSQGRWWQGTTSWPTGRCHPKGTPPQPGQGELGRAWRQRLENTAQPAQQQVSARSWDCHQQIAKGRPNCILERWWYAEVQWLEWQLGFVPYTKWMLKDIPCMYVCGMSIVPECNIQYIYIYLFICLFIYIYLYLFIYLVTDLYAY